MKAACFIEKEKIEMQERSPLEPTDDEVRIKVAYCGICGTDMHIYHGAMAQRLNPPQAIGHEASGVVDAVGKNVKHLKLGQKVVVMPLDWCGTCPSCEDGLTHICHNLKFLGIDTEGAFQNYWTLPARAVLAVPDKMDLKVAALIEPLAVALHDLRRGAVKKGDFITVIGGGPIGALIALAARQRGAEVLVSELNEHRLAMFADFGIDAINPLATEITQAVKTKTGGRGADVVFEVSAHPAGLETAVKLPKNRGKIVVVGIFSQPPQISLFDFFWRELELYGARVYEKEDYQDAIDMACSNTLPLHDLISAVYPLEELPQGIQKLQEGGKVMKVLIDCREEVN